jgi:hypothetical protein
MTKLSDTQAIILSAAAQRADGNLLPLPGSLRGGAAAKVVGALLARGLAREEVTDRTTRADTALNTIWRNEVDGRAVLLRITPEGLAALGVEPATESVAEPAATPEAEPATATGAVEYRFNEGVNSAGEPPGGADPTDASEVEPKRRGRPKKQPAPAAQLAAPAATKTRGRRKKATATAAAAPAAPRKTRDDTKQAQLIAMLRRKEGATIAQIVAATGWQPHTVRGAFAGALKKKLGLTVTSEKVEGGNRVYRLPAETKSEAGRRAPPTPTASPVRSTCPWRATATCASMTGRPSPSGPASTPAASASSGC